MLIDQEKITDIRQSLRVVKTANVDDEATVQIAASLIAQLECEVDRLQSKLNACRFLANPRRKEESMNQGNPNESQDSVDQDSDHECANSLFERLRSIHVEAVGSTNYAERPVVPTTIGEKLKSAMGEPLGKTIHYVAGQDWHRLYVNGDSVAWINKGMISQVEALQKALAEGSQVEVFVDVEVIHGRGPSSHEGRKRRKWAKEIQVRGCD